MPLHRAVRPAIARSAVVLCVAVAIVAALGAAMRPASAWQAREPVTFNRDVAPILYANCAVCHRPGESAPFSLLTYQDVRQRARLIATAVATHVMPPWQPESEDGMFVGERRLSARQIATIQQWIEDGLLEGPRTRSRRRRRSKAAGSLARPT